MRRWHLLTTVLVACLASALARGDWTTTQEHWYVVEFGGQPAGWMSVRELEQGEERATETSTEMRLSRGSTPISVKMSTRFVETANGKPVSLQSRMEQSAGVVDSTWYFHDDHVESVTLQGGRTLKNKLPSPEGIWLTPHAASTFVRERLEAGAETFTYRMVTGEQGIEPVAFRHVRTGKESATYAGREIPVTTWEVSTDALPVPALTKYSEDGVMVEQSYTLPGIGLMRTYLGTRGDAIAKALGPAPELMVSLFVPVTPPIDRPRETTKATYRVRAKVGEMPDLPAVGAQRAPRVDDDGAALVSLDVTNPLPAPEEDLTNPAYLEASPMCDTTDEMIRKLAARGVRNSDPSDAARADALRAFVFKYINAKTLDTAFASASEVARQRQGDCSEHGILLCALLRAQGIPARVAVGLVYVEEFASKQAIFGWHMWTQALIDGAWVDLDATIDRRYDAAHLLTATSSLDESRGISDLMSSILMMGNLEIEVVEVGYGE